MSVFILQCFNKWNSKATQLPRGPLIEVDSIDWVSEAPLGAVFPWQLVCSGSADSKTECKVSVLYNQRKSAGDLTGLLTPTTHHRLSITRHFRSWRWFKSL